MEITDSQDLGLVDVYVEEIYTNNKASEKVKEFTKLKKEGKHSEAKEVI